jgi:hypothetical protein
VEESVRDAGLGVRGDGISLYTLYIFLSFHSL